MQTIKDLDDLLMHHVQNLYAAEQHMLDVLPSIIEKVQHRSLKNALTHHLKLTEEQKSRLERIPALVNERITMANEQEAGIEKREQVALLSKKVCKGMQGLIDELNELFEGEVATEVMDAAIISGVQKMEHYEICTYGSAHAYAAQLELHKVEALLHETLAEEYDADDLLTALATASLNKEAESERLKLNNETTNAETSVDGDDDETMKAGKIIISERTVNSPGGRAGTSHRGYSSGESRGH